jgi:hypothetical protein
MAGARWMSLPKWQALLYCQQAILQLKSNKITEKTVPPKLVAVVIALEWTNTTKKEKK